MKKTIGYLAYFGFIFLCAIYGVGVEADAGKSWDELTTEQKQQVMVDAYTPKPMTDEIAAMYLETVGIADKPNDELEKVKRQLALLCDHLEIGPNARFKSVEHYLKTHK